MHEERSGFRDRAYSAWHRRKSISRFVPEHEAELISMIDLDVSIWVEYENGTREPLLLIETAIDNGQDVKVAEVTWRLARRAWLPAYVVLYRLSESRNPADNEAADIDEFRYKEAFPNTGEWVVATPKEYADFLQAQRKIQSDKSWDVWNSLHGKGTT